MGRANPSLPGESSEPFKYRRRRDRQVLTEPSAQPSGQRRRGASLRVTLRQVRDTYAGERLQCALRLLLPSVPTPVVLQTPPPEMRRAVEVRR